MFDKTALIALRDYGIQVTGARGASDDSIIQNVQAFLPDGDFLELASDLNNISVSYNFNWHTVAWKVSDGYINGTLLTMEYEALVEMKKLTLERRLSNSAGQLMAHHDYLCLPASLQSMNMSREINGALLKQYKKMEVRTIETYAGLDVDGYVWAKAGFSAIDQEEVDDVLVRARRLQLQSDAVIGALQRQVDRHFVQNPSQPFPIWQWGSVPSLKGLLIGSLWKGQLNLYNQ